MIYALIIFAALCIIALFYAIISLKLLKTTKYKYHSDKLPNYLNGKKAALISDLHCCHFGRNNKRLFDKIRSEAPDYIFITGDLINGVKAEETAFTEEFLSELSQLKIPLFYCLGNHESKLADYDRTAYVNNIIIIRKYTTLLLNSTVYLDDEHEVSITGIRIPQELYHGRHKGTRVARIIKKAENNIPAAEYKANNTIENDTSFKLLLAHDPYYFKRYSELDFDIVLSGHVHGGIIRFPFIGGFISPRITFFPKYDKGCFEENGCTMYLSAGLGWHNLPIRFLNTPELVVIDFKK